jgi:hypothetical protein
VPQLEVWEKVFVDAEALQEDVHGEISCIDCHGGLVVQGDDMNAKYAAHNGVIIDPSVDATASCGECHDDIAPYQEYSLHNNLAGYDTALYARAPEENHQLIEVGEESHCDGCHTTCGQCHISRPDSVGGGFVDGHVINRTPSMMNQCTACHGSRVKNEYTGAHEDLQADIHLRKRMTCTDCHTGGELHGTDFIDLESDDPFSTVPEHRYDGAQGPSCESCHAEVVGAESDNRHHRIHSEEILSCQGCHSVAYINCYGCHLERTEDEWDLPYFKLQEEEVSFYIGLNPIQSEDRPYQYVPVRHVPTWPGLFDLYGDNILSEFENTPTWDYATPHNIQLVTPQTESCDSCHGSAEYFLTEDKVLPEEVAQNATVIVPGPIPALLDPSASSGDDDD